MKVTEKIHQLKIDFEITITPEIKISRFVNVILIFGDKITLIDTGVKESEKIIFDYILENGRNLTDIETIILSHSHPDHIGSAAIIRELTSCRILAHKSEREWIENIEIQNRERPVPGFFNLVNRSVKIDDYLADKQELTLGEALTAKIIHSPGHSKGSLNVLFREDKVLFTADSVPLKNDIPNYDNYVDLINTLHVIRSDKEYRTLLSSWTPPLSDMTDIENLLAEGEAYMKRIDEAVIECYGKGKAAFPDSCTEAIAKLGLPSFLANHVVNRAFLSHLSYI